jgi:hypothetical protein
MPAEMTDSMEEFEGMAYRAGRKKKKNYWPTPSANKITASGEIVNADENPWDGESKPHSKSTGKPIQTALSDAVQMWPTPLASDADKYNLNRDKYLTGAVQKYPTPTSSMMTLQDMEQARFSGTDKRRPKYGEAWPAPTAGDYAGMFLTPRATDTGKGERQETFLKRMGDRTDKCHQSLPSQIGGSLSADWVEALMGYPLGWTDIDKEAGMENLYPEKWLDGTWEDGIPRVAVKQAHRVSRIKCLGNAIVPQCTEMIFMSPAFDPWRE